MGRVPGRRASGPLRAMITPRMRRLVLAGALACIWALILGIPYLRGQNTWIEASEFVLLDWRYSTFGPIDPPQDVVIVAIDDATLAGTLASDGGRRQLAMLIDQIADAGAKALALNILLTDAGSDAEDAALQRALTRIPSVVAAAAGSLTEGDPNQIPRSTDEFWPRPGFADAASTALVNVRTDGDGTPRYVPLLFLTSRGVIPSMALQAATLFGGVEPRFGVQMLTLGNATIPLEAGARLPLRLRGPARTIPTISASDILNGDVSGVTGKLVVLGATATGVGDRFPNPFGGDMPGVEVIATAVAQLIDGTTLRRDSRIRRADLFASVLLAVICTVMVLRLPLSFGVPSAASFLLPWMGAVWLFFPMGIWMGAALPLASAIPPAAMAGAYRYIRERRNMARSARAVSQLKKFQSPEFAEKIADDPDFLITPETRDLVVLFVDLAGFTGLSQILGPEGTQDLLKQFHGRVASTVAPHGGIIINYMGDGALVIFGATDDAPDPYIAGCRAGFELIGRIGAMGTDMHLADPLDSRVGVHSGPIVLSRLGDDRQQQLSVAGDAVNLASRLLEMAKAQGMNMAVTETVIAQLTDLDLPPPNHTGAYPVRGREGEVKILFWDVSLT
ncbi:CHASE2 domain-containing protein [Phaeobacter marinintestinus]|uniref:CHASE2 domain-containing protein n=1 Tax=Falsiphaeobacter marinintestinus TaxID=1492905 RepID=UPI0011B807D6|nr:adenylate/guanylate cyclase domain-containing protein [Phaeobacter marinintestinus]